MLGHDGRVVLEPLHIVLQVAHARGGLKVFDGDHRLVGAAVALGITIYLDEAIDHVHHRGGVLHPGDIVIVPDLQVTCLVKLDELSE